MYVRSATEFLLTQIWFTAELFLFEMETDFFSGNRTELTETFRRSYEAQKEEQHKIKKDDELLLGNFLPLSPTSFDSQLSCLLHSGESSPRSEFHLQIKLSARRSFSLEIYKSNTWRRNEFGFSNKSVDYLSY